MQVISQYDKSAEQVQFLQYVYDAYHQRDKDVQHTSVTASVCY